MWYNVTNLLLIVIFDLKPNMTHKTHIFTFYGKGGTASKYFMEVFTMSKILRRCLSLVLALMLLASVSFSGSLNASADNKTGYGLAAYAMRAYNEGWSYVWGGASPGAVDCSGLIYSYVGGGARVTEDMLYSSPESGYVANGVPDIPGLGLWQPGHVGVYVGGGMAVDARDEISNVCYQSVSTKSWVMWFKVAGVSYDTDTVVTNDNVGNNSSTDSENPDDKSVKPAQTDTALQLGSTGSDVNKLQERLKYLGYFTDNTTEYFGYVTQGALMEFQQTAGLGVTGVYDAATKAALEASDAPAKVVEPEQEEMEAASDPDDNENDYSWSADDSDDLEENSTNESQTDVSTEEKEPPVPEGEDEVSDSAAFDSDTESDEQSSANCSDDDAADNTLEAVPEDVVFKPGDVSAELSDIQYVLIKLGYFDYDITGVYCDNTADAVSEFRKDYGLEDARYLDENATAVLYAVYEGTYVIKEQSEAYEPMAALADDVQEETDSDLNEGESQQQSVTITLEGSDSTNDTNVQAETENTEEAEKADTDFVSSNIDTETETETDKPSAADSDSVKPAESENKSASSTVNVISPKTSDNSQVVFVQTGEGDRFSTAYVLIAVGISLIIIFFIGTVHYWNVSMEKRKQRARRATTVSVYHRSSM